LAVKIRESSLKRREMRFQKSRRTGTRPSSSFFLQIAKIPHGSAGKFCHFFSIFLLALIYLTAGESNASIIKIRAIKKLAVNLNS
jgi:hypothetical protein